jgi:NTP pyrophosphatase (non-canonical NTP hydrolase)
MVDRIIKWRRDFDIKTSRRAAMQMLKEEFLELMVEFDALTEDEVTAEFKKEWADLMFVAVQVADAFGIDPEPTIQAVLDSNYSKCLTREQFDEMYPTDCPYSVKIRGNYVFLYNEDGKLMKGPNYKPARL